MTSEEIAWLAGIIEGEGYFGIYKGQWKPGIARLQIGMTDRDVIEKIANLLNTTVSINNRGKKKTCYFTSLARRRDLKRLLISILPYMGNRRSSKIHELLEHINSIGD